MLFGSIETGGTKFVVAVGDEHGQVQEKITIPTTTPTETMPRVHLFLEQFDIQAIGVGAFGPINIDPGSPHYGHIMATPKIPWRFYDFVGALKHHHNLPVAWTTDVNAAGYGEFMLGHAKDVDSCLYLTVGTGIGGGFIHNGTILNAYGHPEMGHLRINKHPDDDFVGACPSHNDCLEGLASGYAMEKRWGQKGKDLTDNKKVWEIEAYYIAQALMNYTLVLRPENIILGGGVMKQKQIFPLVRAQFHDMMNDYVETPDLDDYIQPVGLDDEAGIIGGLLLAKAKLENTFV